MSKPTPAQKARLLQISRNPYGLYKQADSHYDFYHTRSGYGGWTAPMVDRLEKNQWITWVRDQTDHMCAHLTIEGKRAVGLPA